MGIALLVAANWFLGAFSLLLSLFLLTSYSGINIDTTKRMIRPYNIFFGFIKTGKWESIDKYIGLTLIPMRRVYAVYSRSNQQNISTEKDFRIYLVNKAKKPSIPIKKCRTPEKAQNCIDELSIWLKLPVYTVK